MTTGQKKPNRIHNILWIAQWLLAFTFIWAGYMKIFRPEKLPFLWVKEDPRLAFFTGIVDLLGGIGIVLPALLRIKPKLTIYAASGIILLMISACIFHISRGEAKDIGFNIFMMVMAGFVAWGRSRKAPIEPK